jgi:hypothetical protein
MRRRSKPAGSMRRLRKNTTARSKEVLKERRDCLGESSVLSSQAAFPFLLGCRGQALSSLQKRIYVRLVDQAGTSIHEAGDRRINIL